jgi:TM2 domain-containing membrane protein YozV
MKAFRGPMNDEEMVGEPIKPGHADTPGQTDKPGQAEPEPSQAPPVEDEPVLPPPPYVHPERASSSPSTSMQKFINPYSTTGLTIELYIVTVSLRWLGMHWFWLGRPGWGALYFCTLGLFGVGWAIDMIRLPHLVSRSKSGFDKDGTVDLLDMYVLCLCPITGLFLAAHHWALRRREWASLHMLTLGFIGVGWAVDLLRLPLLVSELNRALALKTADLPFIV